MKTRKKEQKKPRLKGLRLYPDELSSLERLAKKRRLNQSRFVGEMLRREQDKERVDRVSEVVYRCRNCGAFVSTNRFDTPRVDVYTAMLNEPHITHDCRETVEFTGLLEVGVCDLIGGKTV